MDKYIWCREKAVVFKDRLLSPELQENFKTASDKIDEDIDSSIKLFTDSLLDAAKCMKKSIVRGGKNKDKYAAWFDKECVLKKKEVRMHLRKFRKKHAEEDFISYSRSRKEYKSLLLQTKNEEKKAAMKRLEEAASQSPKEFWSEIRKNRRKKRIGNNIDQQDWTNHFEKVFNEGFDMQNNVINDTTDEHCFNDTLDAEISETEIVNAIRHLKTGKAAGPDNILSEMLKLAEHLILPYLKKCFNAIFSAGHFPVEWTKAIIVPLYKKGDANMPDNYRGISLLSVLSKVFTHIMNSRLYKWSEDNFVLNDAQAGFRKGRSTIDHIFTLHAVIEKHLLKNTKLYVAFIDFKKAYDRVNRNILWPILIKSGIRGKMIRMLKSMYSNVQACILCERGKTEFFQCLQGLKQGCILSPILFSLLINELANELISNGKHGVSLGASELELFLLMFADYLTLLSSTVIGLQNQLNVLSKVIKRLSLTVNLDKSNIVVFRKGGFLASKEKWFLDGNRLEVVNSYRYLGLTFTTKHSFKAAMEETAIRAKKSTIEILRTMTNLKCNSPDIFFRLFDAQILPSLLYGAEVWGYAECTEIERVHLFACKRFMHVVNKTPNDIIYGELGRYPLWITAMVRYIKYWCKLLKQPTNHYSRKAYNMSLSLHEKGFVTWASHVKEILYENGFQQVWLFGTENVKVFGKILRERLCSSFCHTWLCHITSSERLQIYGTYKDCLERELYVDSLWLDIYRNSLAQFRMGVSQINVHLHRFTRRENDKECPFGCQKLESEIHFLFECTIYDKLRGKYLNDFCKNENVQQNFKSVMNCTSQKDILNLAKFLFYAFKVRQLTLSDQE